jgi:hypothetical protein
MEEYVTWTLFIVCADKCCLYLFIKSLYIYNQSLASYLFLVQLGSFNYRWEVHTLGAYWALFGIVVTAKYSILFSFHPI